MADNKCSNCNKPFQICSEGELVVLSGIQPVAAICPECASGAKLVKIVVRRDANGFAYEQYTVLEMENKPFGKPDNVH